MHYKLQKSKHNLQLAASFPKINHECVGTYQRPTQQMKLRVLDFFTWTAACWRTDLSKDDWAVMFCDSSLGNRDARWSQTCYLAFLFCDLIASSSRFKQQ